MIIIEMGFYFLNRWVRKNYPRHLSVFAAAIPFLRGDLGVCQAKDEIDQDSEIWQDKGHTPGPSQEGSVARYFLH